MVFAASFVCPDKLFANVPLVEFTAFDVSPVPAVRVHSGDEKSLLPSTCHSVSACVSPTSASENAEAESVGFTETFVAPFEGEEFVGVLGAVFKEVVMKSIVKENP